MPGQGAPGRGAPAVTWQLVVRYAKRGRMRFASHLDIARAVERGVRRAGLPIAYSAGFTPHPKISYAGAAPTGAASEAEYLELSLTRACAVSEVRERLDAALPDGIDVIEVMQAPPALGALPRRTSDRVHAAREKARASAKKIAPDLRARRDCDHARAPGAGGGTTSADDQVGHAAT